MVSSHSQLEADLFITSAYPHHASWLRPLKPIAPALVVCQQPNGHMFIQLEPVPLRTIAYSSGRCKTTAHYLQTPSRGSFQRPYIPFGSSKSTTHSPPPPNFSLLQIVSRGTFPPPASTVPPRLGRGPREAEAVTHRQILGLECSG